MLTRAEILHNVRPYGRPDQTPRTCDASLQRRACNLEATIPEALLVKGTSGNNVATILNRRMGRSDMSVHAA